MSSAGNSSEKTGIYTLAQMIDLAVGTPEIGHVDFNMLQGVLHVLAQRTHNKQETVEIRWGDIIPCRPTFIITELSDVDDDSSVDDSEDDGTSNKENMGEGQSEATRKTKKQAAADKFRDTDDKNISGKPQGVEKDRGSKKARGSGKTHGLEEHNGPEEALGSQKPRSSENPHSLEKRSRSEKQQSADKRSGLSSPERARILAERISRVKMGQDSRSGSPGYISQQGGSDVENIHDLEDARNTSRGQSNRTSRQNVCDCKDMKASKDGRSAEERRKNRGQEGSAEERRKNRRQGMSADERRKNRHQEGWEDDGETTSSDMWQDSSLRIMDMESTLADLLKRFDAVFSGPVKPCGKGGAAAELEALGLDRELVLELDSVRGRIARVVNNCDCAQNDGDQTNGNVPFRLNIVEKKVKLLEIAFDRQGEDYNEQLGAVMQDIPRPGELSICDPCLASATIQSQMEGLGSEITTIKEYMVRLEPVFGLLDTKEEKQKRVEVLIEQVELLKVVKADREDVESWLADKADTNNLLRKVSYDAFDSVCDDLQNALRGALNKLTVQETLWQQALDDVQREIENKLDKGEMPSLKNFVNERIKLLQDRLRELANIKEKEASSAKSKYLRDVNCLSCDADVVMRKEEAYPRIPAGAPMPPGKAIRPYHSSQLEAVRKKQRQTKEGSGISLCMRYCGGPHTRTTPAQRVARAGHFLAMFGPQVQPIPGTLGPGADGRMYNIASEAGDAATAVLQPLKHGGAHPVSARGEMEKYNEEMEQCRCGEGKTKSHLDNLKLFSYKIILLCGLLS